MQTQEEIWKDIIGFEGYYQVNPKGFVKSVSKKLPNKNGFRTTKERIIANSDNGSGYFVCCLSKNNKRSSVLLHRIVAINFIPNPYNLPEVNHKDGDKSNNSVGNLEWCTRKENIEHSWKNNLTTCIGEGHHNSKLDNNIVIDIRKKYASGDYSYSKIAKELGINMFTVRNVVKRYTWNNPEL